MELIDDWPRPGPEQTSASRRKGSSGNASGAELTARAIGDRLAGFKPQILQVNCFEDVGLRWVQVAFGATISPRVALAVGHELVALAGEGQVLLNSLRPQSVFFVLEPASGAEPTDLPASRYGTVLSEVRKAWLGPSAVPASAGGRGSVSAARS